MLIGRVERVEFNFFYFEIWYLTDFMLNGTIVNIRRTNMSAKFNGREWQNENLLKNIGRIQQKF